METVLEQAVQRWREADLLDESTAAAIRSYEEDRGHAATAPASHAPPSAGPREATDDDGLLPHGRAGLVAEGLAYLGAALAFGAGFALFAEVWQELSGLARTLVVGAGTLAVGGAAAALAGADTDPVRRLRSLLGALAVLGVAATVAIGLSELATLDEDVVMLLAGVTGLAAAVPVHLARPSWPSALVMGAAVVTTTIAGESVLGIGDTDVAAGVTLAGLGLAWAALAWSGHLRPRAAFEVPGLLVGGLGIQIVGFSAFPVGALLVGLAVAGGVLALGMLEDRTSLAVLGGLGITVFAPQLVFEVFGDTIGGPLALFVGGVALVGVAVMVLRQRARA